MEDGGWRIDIRNAGIQNAGMQECRNAGMGADKFFKLHDETLEVIRMNDLKGGFWMISGKTGWIQA